MKVLIAGVGNVLRADDAFGVEVARRMADLALPPGVRVVETGIAGIALVQELQEGWDVLVVVDAVDHGRPAGTVMLIEPDVLDVNTLSATERRDQLADMHLATPERSMMLARALGVLPPTVLMVGCQIADPDAVGEGMTDAVSAAVDVAIDEIQRYLATLVGPTGGVGAQSA